MSRSNPYPDGSTGGKAYSEGVIAIDYANAKKKERKKETIKKALMRAKKKYKKKKLGPKVDRYSSAVGRYHTYS